MVIETVKNLNDRLVNCKITSKFNTRKIEIYINTNTIFFL